MPRWTRSYLWIPFSVLVVADLAAQGSGPLASGSESRWELVGLPYVNFGSDEGLGYGVIGGAYLQSPSEGLPYRLSLEPTLFMTTEGRRDLTLFMDAPGMLPPGWRVDVSGGLERNLAVPYYGVGNDTPYAPDLEEDGRASYYRFGRNRRHLRVNVQRTISGTPIRVLAGAGAARTVVDSGARGEGPTLLAEELEFAGRLPPVQTRSLRIGLVRDTRDHETVPRRGSWSEFLVEQNVEAVGGDLAFTRWTAADRRFLAITGSLVLAHRFVIQEVRGPAPPHELMRIPSSFKEQEGLGGAGTVRGLPQNRCVGRGLFLWNVELRWEADEVRIHRFGVRPGAVAFLDSGRVWEGGVHPPELLRDLHHAAGMGLRFRLGDSFLISADLGRSSGSPLGFYLGVGHLF